MTFGVNLFIGGTCGVTVIAVGKGFSEWSSNPGRGRLHFT